MHSVSVLDDTDPFDDLLKQLESVDKETREAALQKLHGHAEELTEPESYDRLGLRFIRALIKKAPSDLGDLDAPSTLYLAGLLRTMLTVDNPVYFHQALTAGLLDALDKIWASYYIHSQLFTDQEPEGDEIREQERLDNEKLEEAYRLVTELLDVLKKRYVWLELYQFLDNGQWPVAHDEAENPTFLVNAVRAEGMLYGLLFAFHNENGYTKRKNQNTNIPDLGKLMLSMVRTPASPRYCTHFYFPHQDMLTAAAMAEYNPSYEVARLLLANIQKEVNNLLQQYPRWRDLYKLAWCEPRVTAHF